MLNLMSFSPSHFGRYLSETEKCTDETIDVKEWSPECFKAITDISSNIATSTTSSTEIATDLPQRSTTILSSLVAEDVEPLPFLHHGPGPIQRPNKLNHSSTNTTSSIKPPGTPDVLDQINHFLYENSTNTAGTSTPNANQIPVTLPNTPWTPFSSTEWSPKYESSWPLPSLQSPNIALTTLTQNPFAMMSRTNEYQRQLSRSEAPVWSSSLGTGTPRYTSPSIRTQRASVWNDLFSSAVPSATDGTKPNNNSWLKFWSAPDPSTTDGTSMNGHGTGAHNSFWNLSSLSNDSVVPSSSQNRQPASPSTWWSVSSSDENNNTNRLNNAHDDLSTTRDQSRWDFAR